MALLACAAVLLLLGILTITSGALKFSYEPTGDLHYDLSGLTPFEREEFDAKTKNHGLETRGAGIVKALPPSRSLVENTLREVRPSSLSRGLLAATTLVFGLALAWFGAGFCGLSRPSTAGFAALAAIAVFSAWLAWRHLAGNVGATMLGWLGLGSLIASLIGITSLSSLAGWKGFFSAPALKGFLGVLACGLGILALIEYVFLRSADSRGHFFGETGKLAQTLPWYEEDNRINLNNEIRILSNGYAMGDNTAEGSADEWVLQTRTRELPEGPSDRKRILLMGDSFVWGDGHQNQNMIWWRQLQVELERRGYWDVDIVPHGKCGASLREQWEKVPRAIEKYHPDLILWGYFSNDADEYLIEGQGYETHLLKQQGDPVVGVLNNLSDKKIFPRIISNLKNRRLASMMDGRNMGAADMGIWLGMAYQPDSKNWIAHTETIREVSDWIKGSEIPQFFMAIPDNAVGESPYTARPRYFPTDEERYTRITPEGHDTALKDGLVFKEGGLEALVYCLLAEQGLTVSEILGMKSSGILLKPTMPDQEGNGMQSLPLGESLKEAMKTIGDYSVRLEYSRDTTDWAGTPALDRTNLTGASLGGLEAYLSEFGYLLTEQSPLLMVGDQPLTEAGLRERIQKIGNNLGISDLTPEECRGLWFTNTLYGRGGTLNAAHLAVEREFRKHKIPFYSAQRKADAFGQDYMEHLRRVANPADGHIATPITMGWAIHAADLLEAHYSIHLGPKTSETFYPEYIVNDWLPADMAVTVNKRSQIVNVTYGRRLELYPVLPVGKPHIRLHLAHPTALNEVRLSDLWLDEAEVWVTAIPDAYPKVEDDYAYRDPGAEDLPKGIGRSAAAYRDGKMLYYLGKQKRSAEKQKPLVFSLDGYPFKDRVDAVIILAEHRFGVEEHLESGHMGNFSAPRLKVILERTNQPPKRPKTILPDLPAEAPVATPKAAGEVKAAPTPPAVDAPANEAVPAP